MIIIKITIKEHFGFKFLQIPLPSTTIIPEWLGKVSCTREHRLQVVDKILQQGTGVKSPALDILNTVAS